MDTMFSGPLPFVPSRTSESMPRFGTSANGQTVGRSRTTSAHGIIKVNLAHTGGVSHGAGGWNRSVSRLVVAARVVTRRRIVRSADPSRINVLHQPDENGRAAGHPRDKECPWRQFTRFWLYQF